MTKKQTLFFSMSLEECRAFLIKHEMPKFMASQLFDWVYKKQCLDVSHMKNISKENQKKLKEILRLTPFKSVQTVISKEENAIKNVCLLDDGNSIECVILKEKNYNTLCISSQCGCPVDCKFCLTGVVGMKRQLTSGEIVAQVVHAFSIGYPIKNIVFMGMGEPLLNYNEVMSSIDLLTSKESYNFSKRHITLSTSGYIQGVKQLIKDERYINIAFSVGSADPLKRIQFMPTEERNPIVEFIKTLKEYQALHNRKLTLEYTLLEGVNDSEYDMQSLMNLSVYLNAKINLINLNPHPKIPYKPISIKTLLKLRDRIKAKKIPVTIRYKKGQDITAACGQLGESLLQK